MRGWIHQALYILCQNMPDYRLWIKLRTLSIACRSGIDDLSELDGQLSIDTLMVHIGQPLDLGLNDLLDLYSLVVICLCGHYIH